MAQPIRTFGPEAEKKRAYYRAWRAKNPYKVKENQRRAAEKQRERRRAYYKVWCAKNKGKHRETGLRWIRADEARYLKMLRLTTARSRAKKLGLAFNLTIENITWPDRCPILGVPLNYAFGAERPRANSPSLDRIDSTKGYTSDNVQVISWRANRIKCDATVEELRRLADYMEMVYG